MIGSREPLATRPVAERTPPGSAMVPAVAFWYVRISGMLSILAWIVGDPFERLVRHGAWKALNGFWWLPSLPFGVLMILLSLGVRRGKRAAWRILVTLFTLGLLGEGAAAWERGPGQRGHVVSACVLGIAVALLLVARRHFRALPDRTNRHLALAVFTALLMVTSLLGATVVAATDQDPAGNGWAHLAYAWIQAVTGSASEVPELGVTVSAWVDALLGALGGGLLVVTAWALFRPSRWADAMDPEEEAAVRGLLEEYGEQDSLGYFALRREKDVVFAPNSKAAVAYRVVGSVTLASGDPLGDPESWHGAIDAWLHDARRHAWTPAVLGAGEQGATAYARAGLRVIELGDEAVLDLAAFRLDRPELRPVRQAVRRVERAGYTIRIRRHGQIPPEEMNDLAAHVEKWRGAGGERGFSMALGRLGDPADADCVMVEARDRGGVLRGLLSFVPWGMTGLSLDLMRRDRDAENGLNEFMIVKLAAGGPSLGVERLSLNFAMLRWVFDRGARIGAGPVLRLTHRACLLASRMWQLESLYRANAKYAPTWVPRYLCFPGGRDLARVGLAAARAEGFLPLSTSRLAPPAPAGTRVVPSRPALRPPMPERTEQERTRRRRLDRIRAAGMEPFPLGFPRTATAAQIRARHVGLPADTRTGRHVAVAGRVIGHRCHGRISFATLRDETGEIQVLLAADQVGEQALTRWKRLVDRGDHVGVRGEVVTSRHGELSIAAMSWTPTGKCLRPLPDPRGGLDTRARVRDRSGDLIVNEAAGRMLRMRGATLAAVRAELLSRGFLEVETPILQPVHGGAAARPFATRSNAYGVDMYLRIAPELYLKRLLVGGAGKIFELGRSFRNEGADAGHSPEFTMLEAYEPCGDARSVAALTRDLVLAAARATLGTTTVERDGVAYDLAQPWRQTSVYAEVSDAVGEKITPDTPMELVGDLARSAGVAHAPGWSQGRIVQELFEALVETRLQYPTLVFGYPTETAPLARPDPADPRLADKWDLIVFGRELATGQSELTDPLEQRRRLVEQAAQAARGDAAAMRVDEDFLRGLEYALPPCGGLGLGIDRLLMTLSGRSIRETLAFPPVRPL